MRCPLGYDNTDSGSTSCVGIPPGSYFNSSLNQSVSCEKGFKCTGKDAGREAWISGNVNGSVSCVLCAPKVIRIIGAGNL